MFNGLATTGGDAAFPWKGEGHILEEGVGRKRRRGMGTTQWVGKEKFNIAKLSLPTAKAE